jgi:hypothetical protein
MKGIFFLILLSISSFNHANPVHPCATQARQQAKKLLEFHFGADERIAIDDKVAVLKPLKNPAGKGKFDVLEVYGYIYKGTYRMHFIYGQVQNECVLVGQEILELTNL